jgi:hypothetical protein
MAYIHHMAVMAPPDKMLRRGSPDICTVRHIATLVDIIRDHEATAALWCRGIREAA